MNAVRSRRLSALVGLLSSPLAMLVVLALIFVTMVADGLSVEVVGLTVRPPYLVVPLAVLVAVAACVGRKSPFVIALPGVFLILWLVALLLASILSPLPLPSTPIQILRLSLLAAIFLVIPNLITDEKIGRQALQIFIAVVVGELMLSLILLSIQQLTGAAVPGVKLDYGECPVPAALGTMIESNFLGQLAGASVLLTFILLVSKAAHLNISRRLLIVGLVVSSLALLFSLARQVWVATLVLLPLTLLLTRELGGNSIRRLATGVGISAGIGTIFLIALFVLPPTFGPICRGWNLVRGAATMTKSQELEAWVDGLPAYQRVVALTTSQEEWLVALRAQQEMLSQAEADRLRQSRLALATTGGSSILHRVDVAQSGLQLWLLRPVIGWGVLSGQRVTMYTSNTHALQSWQINMVIFLLDDAGLVGAVIFTLFLCTLIWQAWRHATHGSAPWNIVSRGFLIVFVLLIIAYQATQSLWIAMPYVIGGLLTAYSALSATPRELITRRLFSIVF